MNQPTNGLNTRSLMLSGLFAGLGIGVLSNLPLIACVNCLLLGWVWGGGIFAVYLYRSYQGRPYLTSSQGLIIGAVAGAIGAVVGGIMVALLGGLTTAINQTLSSMAGEASDYIPGFLLSTGFNLLGTLGSIVIYALVGAIGGLIATSLIWKAPMLPPPPTYTQPPAGPNA